MPVKTKIQWADYVSNPIKARYVTPPMPMLGGREVTKAGWACVKISEGCQHCWASRFNVRLGTGLEYTRQNLNQVEIYVVKREVERMILFAPRGKFKGGRERALVFVCDMTDLFGDWVADEAIDCVFDAMRESNRVDYVVLTKRASRAYQYLKSKHDSGKTPLDNIFIGASVENQDRANLRLTPMSEIAKMGWKTVVSYEPALGAVDWRGWEFLNWLICGGESGAAARTMSPDWAMAARDFCVANSIPFFFKQWGEWMPFKGSGLGELSRLKHKPLLIDNHIMCRVGKGLAGNLLDWQKWEETPR